MILQHNISSKYQHIVLFGESQLCFNVRVAILIKKSSQKRYGPQSVVCKLADVTRPETYCKDFYLSDNKYSFDYRTQEKGQDLQPGNGRKKRVIRQRPRPPP
jgi:hypothetical protein